MHILVAQKEDSSATSRRLVFRSDKHSGRFNESGKMQGKNKARRRTWKKVIRRLIDFLTKDVAVKRKGDSVGSSGMMRKQRAKVHVPIVYPKVK